jgi:hypothetical protein
MRVPRLLADGLVVAAILAGIWSGIQVFGALGG